MNQITIHFKTKIKQYLRTTSSAATASTAKQKNRPKICQKNHYHPSQYSIQLRLVYSSSAQLNLAPSRAVLLHLAQSSSTQLNLAPNSIIQLHLALSSYAGHNLASPSSIQLRLTQSAQLSSIQVRLVQSSSTQINCLLYTSPSPRDS